MINKSNNLNCEFFRFSNIFSLEELSCTDLASNKSMLISKTSNTDEF